MRTAVVAQLVALNRRFYEQLADPFAESRATPWPGFARLAAALPQPCARFLDVGCGDGRLGRYLLAAGAIEQYTGIDNSARLLALAEAQTAGVFLQRDLSAPDALHGVGPFDGMAALAVLHHIPGRRNRVRLLADLGRCLAADGRLIVANFQFLRSARLRRRVQAWSQLGLTADDVEPGDYLLDWQRGGHALRYLALIDGAEMADLASEAGLKLLDQFMSDGHSDDLNLYCICGK